MTSDENLVQSCVTVMMKVGGKTVPGSRGSRAITLTAKWLLLVNGLTERSLAIPATVLMDTQTSLKKVGHTPRTHPNVIVKVGRTYTTNTSECHRWSRSDIHHKHIWLSLLQFWNVEPVMAIPFNARWNGHSITFSISFLNSLHT